MNRRDFLQFLGATSALAAFPGCASHIGKTATKESGLPHLLPSLEDKLLVSDGLNHKILISWGDKINATQKFGYNNDFIAFHPLAPDHGILWVNHEYVNPVFIKGIERTKKNVDAEMLEVGGSLLEIKKVGSEWQVVPNSKYNRRLDANTKIPFAWNEPIKGSKFALGTMGNCAGGYTPWGNILTCEENYDMFWGDRTSKGDVKDKSWVKWDKFYPRAPEHYGWVVEVEPLTGKAKKLISMGRCAHEAAAVTFGKNGKVVAYTGDDTVNEHFYKFISDTHDSLEKGKLYVANIEKGQWLSLDINDQPILKKHFKNQTEVQIFAREAAKLLGATELDRPEDIEFDPLTGNVLVALTNNRTKNNYYGSILKIMEKDNDPASLTFTSETFLAGGKENGFACPDNMVFDPKGNLWFTCDMSGRDVNNGPYEGFGNNSLFVFLRSGTHAGTVIRVASAPVDAEFTGPCFSKDYQTLFLSVQHPGEEGTPEKQTSTWPTGKIAKPSVVTIKGPLLDKIVSGEL
jgi:secreted PhoX family phosphatase